MPLSRQTEFLLRRPVMKQKTLRQRIAVIALMPILVVSAVIGVLFIRWHADDLQTLRLASAQATIGQLAALSDMALATRSRLGARQTVEFMQRTVAPIGLGLFDRDGNAFETSGNVGAFALRAISGKPLGLQIEFDERTLSLVQPVFFPAQSVGDNTRSTPSVVGYVSLTLSNEAENAELRRLWFKGLGMLIVAGLIGFFFASRVTQTLTLPLSKLNVAFDRVRAGDLDVRVEHTGADDLRRLTDSFNAMAIELKSARQNLRREVSAATAALDKRTQEAEAANEAKSRFIAAASHDLRQPAHALALYTAALRQLLKRCPEDQRETWAPAINGMDAASKSLSDLLNALLDMSRFDAGVVEVKKSLVSLDELIGRAVTVATTGAAQRGLKLTTRAPSVDIVTDATLLRRIVDNLLNNAIRYTRRGRILVSARRRGDHVLLQVWDQGIGIAAADLPKVFDEFYQVKRGEGSVGGLGLGLAIVARSVTLLDGRLSVRSTLNRGTCFSVWLPTNTSPRREFPATTTTLLPPTRRRVLILDDDPLVRDSMVAWLSARGFDAVACEQLDGLLTAIGATTTDVVAAVVDYRLTDGYTGVEAARCIRARLGTVVPIVLITGDTSAERLRLLSESGFPVLHKPIDVSKLLATLRIEAQENRA